MPRTLRLHRENLTELSTDELAGVVGASVPTFACYLVQQLSERLLCDTAQCTR